MNAAPLFEPVSWLTPEQRRAPHARWLDLIADARDVAGGAAEVLALVQREALDADFEDDNGQPLPSLMSASMRGELVRMSAASLRLLLARLGDALLADAQRLAVLPMAPTWLAASASDLARLIPPAPCAGMVLTAEEAAGLVELRRQLLPVSQTAGVAA